VLERGLRGGRDFFDGRIGDVSALGNRSVGEVRVFMRQSKYFVEVIHGVALRTVKCLGYL